MNQKLLQQNFDRISDAPDAIPRLRQFILDLAVRGKLVEQDPDDEQASELLARILNEKVRLAKCGEIKKQDSLPPIGDAERPFDLPATWAWVRVGEAFQYDAGAKREPKELVPDRWLLELEDIEKDTSVVLTRLKVSDRESLSTKSEFRLGDILYGKLRPYLNKVVVAAEPGYSTTEIVAIRPILPVSSAYCSLAFRRPDFVSYVTRLGQGTKMPRLRTPDAMVALFPLPPLNEQHRIVAKVDELMSLCDRLEAAQSEREATRDRLTVATLHSLSSDADADELRQRSQFFINHLPRLTVRPGQVKGVRQTILELAVRGKLVAQDSGDESASVLLTRVRKDIEAYADDHQITASTPAPIHVEKLPYLAPSGWSWTRLSSVFNVITDGDHQPPPKSTDGIAFLTIGNVTTGSIDFSNCRFVPQSYLEGVAAYRKPSQGDILYTVVGATYGRPVLVDTDRPFCVQRHIAILKPTSEINTRFLLLMLASPLVYEQATRSTTGTAQPTIPLRPLRNFIVPIPPLAEQWRIVARVDELMARCDQLETQLIVRQSDTRRLLDAVLHQALSPVSMEAAS